jgi:hypothetical protein
MKEREKKKSFQISHIYEFLLIFQPLIFITHQPTTITKAGLPPITTRGHLPPSAVAGQFFLKKIKFPNSL